ncbi:MAG TPA: creatininase family protein [Ideonella sp.]|uniref:creatininase family protein n=1 Tax=Ideonella sp. TaxID=1929293 RepID=UPI002E2FABEA|nr:creatininase family protein [Ideonella sp.]HEX5687346.1 creatininase family protein [Ideonella sp.]
MGWRWLLAGLLCCGAASAAAVDSLELDALTSPELRERIAGGTTTVLLPIGGTEQSGPHLALGKHNQRVHALSLQIAQRLGRTLVAPVLAYVPEGEIDPPAAHMRYAGTLSIPEPAFEAVLVAAAQSLCHHGFRDVVLLGDHGGYQRNLEQVAARLERDRARSARPACRTHALAEYYRTAQTTYVDALRARGFGGDEIGTHAGLADTALTLALDPTLVRPDRLARGAGASKDGVQGDPRRATAELGQIGVKLIVDTTVAAIQKRLTTPDRPRETPHVQPPR